MLCVWKMKSLVHDTQIVHGVERRLSYAISTENVESAVCDRAWCGASHVIFCVCGKWRVWCMILG